MVRFTNDFYRQPEVETFAGFHNEVRRVQMISTINPKLGPLRVSVKFPHDTPALVGTMRWNRGEYNIIWDEG
ncbi:MAG: hypothetical protein WAQ53_19105, partial [Thiofilum sp.]|uniref:hypothetical protein n=1 Tax=Thiofilum sp. TaxID=2212733 RepID=UPI003BAF54BA